MHYCLCPNTWYVFFITASVLAVPHATRVCLFEIRPDSITHYVSQSINMSVHWCVGALVC